jgi:hypothetical protein
MTKQRPFTYAADALCAFVAFAAGIGAALYFHGQWFNGGWMMRFGDPPMDNPSYSRFAPIFEAAPYVAAGLLAGIVSGFGHPQLLRLVIRTLGPVLLLLLLSSENPHLAISAFTPSAVAGFAFSTCLSFGYFWLLADAHRITKVS